jgi:hypothetical protein
MKGEQLLNQIFDTIFLMLPIFIFVRADNISVLINADWFMILTACVAARV